SATARAGEDVEIVVRPGGQLAGRVIDARTGRPVPSFTVHVWRSEGPLGSRLEAWRAFVNAEGEFQLGSLATGLASVIVTGANYAPGDEQRVTIGEGRPSRIEVSLRPGAVVRGQVVERDGGAPVAGATVTVESGR